MRCHLQIEQFYFFSVLDDLLLSLAWLLWLGLLVLHWIGVLGVNILILLILEEMLSAFRHWVWCHLWAGPMEPLLCWSKFLLWNLLWKSTVFIKYFFFICWADNVNFSFILSFFFFWPHCMAFRILVPWPGIEPGPSAVKV